MQPQHLRKLVRKWAIVVLAISFAAGALAFGVSRSMTRQYEATGDLLVVAAPRQTTDNPVALNASQVTSTAAALVTEPPLLQKAIDDLKLNENAETLSKQVSATPQTNTELVDVTVRDPDPLRAAKIANTLMADFAAQITQSNEQRTNQAGAALEQQITQLQSTLTQENAQLAAAIEAKQDATQLRAAIQANTALLSQLTTNYASFKATQAQNLETVSVAAPAQAPTQPSSPKVLMNTLLGAFAGLLFALALVALLEYLDQGLHSEEDVVERLGVPCLGVIPRFNASLTDLSNAGRQNSEAASEAYRRLRTNLLFSELDGPLKSVAVTSARAGEGKTRTAANLAVAMGGSDKSVVLVDADMRRPGLHRLFGKPLRSGVSELLLSAAHDTAPPLNGEHATSYPNLSLLTSGTIPPNPSELLASNRSAALLKALEAQHDLVVVDTPPVGAVTDPLSIAAHASATVVVVEAGRTNAQQAEAVITSLRKVGAKVVGVVLNKARKKDAGAYYYYSYSGENGSTSGVVAPGGAGQAPMAPPAHARLPEHPAGAPR